MEVLYSRPTAQGEFQSLKQGGSSKTARLRERGKEVIYFPLTEK
jgi:hypothetical protein